MEPRSESDLVLKQLTLVFDGKEYVVPVLRMIPAAAWRKTFFARTKDISASMIIQNIDDKGELNKSIGNALMGALIKFPEILAELIFSYAPSLPRDEVEAAAYDGELARAFAQIWQVAFGPFLASLGTVLEMQKASESQSTLSGSLN